MAAIYSNGVTAGIFLASILIKGMRYLVHNVYKISMVKTSTDDYRRVTDKYGRVNILNTTIKQHFYGLFLIMTTAVCEISVFSRYCM
jgi:hypothetical protein